MTWFVYILRSQVTDKLYTGISTNPEARLRTHNKGRGAKATRAGRPWTMVYLEKIGSKGEALRREASIKKMPRATKLQLITSLNKSRSAGTSTGNSTGSPSTLSIPMR